VEKEAKQQKKQSRDKNNKIKLRETNSFSDHVRLYKRWISEQQKKGRVLKYRLHDPLP
jgi:hypothetical protein